MGYELYSKYSCQSTIYFDLNPEIIKENCKFDFYYNKTYITPTVLDGGNEIILANWPNDKHIICNINNDTPVNIPSHLYVLVNRSVLCSCGIEAENSFLLELCWHVTKQIQNWSCISPWIQLSSITWTSSLIWKNPLYIWWYETNQL